MEHIKWVSEYSSHIGWDAFNLKLSCGICGFSHYKYKKIKENIQNKVYPEHIFLKGYLIAQNDYKYYLSICFILNITKILMYKCNMEVESKHWGG